MLIFLLFYIEILGGQSLGGGVASRWAPLPPVGENHIIMISSLHCFDGGRIALYSNEILVQRFRNK